MNTTKKLALGGGSALLASAVLMIVVHQLFGHSGGGAMSGPWVHNPSAMSDMGWTMAFGPIAMLLWFGGILSLAAALIRSVAKTA